MTRGSNYHAELDEFDRRVRRALNACRPHAPRWAPSAGGRHDGILTRPARMTLPWARSIATTRTPTLSHLPRWTLIAWYRGRPVGSLVYYACGASSNHARGEPEPTATPCPKCLLADGLATITPATPRLFSRPGPR